MELGGVVVPVCASLPLTPALAGAAEWTRKCGGGEEQRMGMADTRVALWPSTQHHGRLNLSLPQIASRDTEDEALL